jgi:hypothetical protein
MEKVTHKSNSKYQGGLKKEVILPILQKQIFNQIEFLSNTYAPHPKGCGFQIDFYNLEHKIFGEIYSCKFPLKSGHLRKIKGDLLKLLIIEKTLGYPIEKYMVLTVEQAENQGEIVSEIVLKKFGDKSWFSETLKLFDFQIYYYVLKDSEAKLLNETRTKQKEGMKTIISK